jgi:hypothetical protein
MAPVALTSRMDEEERAALEGLSKIEVRPWNRLLNEPSKAFLSTVAAKSAERCKETIPAPEGRGFSALFG